MNPSIIIPTFTNTTRLLSLLTQLSDYEGQVIVVDNKPSEEKKHAARHNLKNGVYLAQNTNLGFARGVNEGVRHATGEWLAILNDDIVLPMSNLRGLPTVQNDLEGRRNALVELINYAKEQKWDAVSPILAKPNGEIENYGYTVLPVGKVKLNFDAKKKDSRVLDGITAACLLIKKSVFDEMKGFDESFFAYLEDVDLFLRIKKAGYSFGIYPDITVIHNHMGTSSKMGWFKEKQDFQNWFRVIGKNWGTERIFLNLPGIFIERLRNLSGLVKKIVKTSFNF